MQASRLERTAALHEHQEKFESEMLDLKLAIKQTEELIASSKQSKFCQSGAYKEPAVDLKKFNPFNGEYQPPEEPPVDENEAVLAKMTSLLKEKDIELAQLVIQRQALEENIVKINRQLDGSQVEIERLKQELGANKQSAVDKEELERMRNESKFLRDKTVR